MNSKPLSNMQRWSFGVVGVLSGAFAGGLTAAAIFAPNELMNINTRIALILGALFAASWAVLGMRIFRRRSINLINDSAVYYGLAWALPVFLLTLFMVCAPSDLAGLRMITSGIAFLIMGLAFLMRGVIERSELQTRERLVKIDDRISELEKLLRLKQ